MDPDGGAKLGGTILSCGATGPACGAECITDGAGGAAIVREGMAGAGAAPAEDGAAKLGRTLFSRGAPGTALGTAAEPTGGACTKFRAWRASAEYRSEE